MDRATHPVKLPTDDDQVALEIIVDGAALHIQLAVPTKLLCDIIEDEGSDITHIMTEALSLTERLQLAALLIGSRLVMDRPILSTAPL